MLLESSAQSQINMVGLPEQEQSPSRTHLTLSDFPARAANSSGQV
jgi:hypothetical protein